VALPFKVASSSQIKQGGIILRHLSPHLWTTGSNRTPQEGCGPRDRIIHHTVQRCPHHDPFLPNVPQTSSQPRYVALDATPTPSPPTSHRFNGPAPPLTMVPLLPCSMGCQPVGAWPLAGPVWNPWWAWPIHIVASSI
jgi:hypothetical protein